jgi:His/Glu/Gln/Arg/opine family amino acid ABC transporter permease subunit
MQWSDLIDYFPDLMHGLWITLSLVALALFLGGNLALLMTCARLSKCSYVDYPVRAFIFFIRGTPLLVQIFLIYFGSGQFDVLRESWLWELLKQPFICAVIALGLNSSAYTTELFLGAVNSIPKGELEAASAFAMSWGCQLKRIIAPRAWRLVLPSYSNEVILLIKSSSLASSITLLDLMGMTQQIINQTYATIPWLCVAGFVYLLVNGFLMAIFHYVERRIPKQLQ